MPTYVYSTDDGVDRIERFFAIGRAPKRIRWAGETYFRDLAAEHGVFASTPGNWPRTSEAMGCHPSQVAEYRQRASSLGVPTEIKNDGTVVLRDRAHEKKFMKAFGFYHQNAGYGDVAPTYK